MSLRNMNDLNDIHIDVLRELGSIGQGNAASSLSQIIGASIDISVPTVRLLDLDETVNYLGGPENIVLGMLVGLQGDIQGMMLYVLQKDFATSMINSVFGKNVDDLLSLDDMDKSFVQEIGNILAGSYVNAISALSGLTIDISVPTIAIDMAGAILAVPAVQFAQLGSKVLFIDDNFEFSGAKSGKSSQVKSNMILVPELDSLTKLFSHLGVAV